MEKTETIEQTAYQKFASYMETTAKQFLITSVLKNQLESDDIRVPESFEDLEMMLKNTSIDKYGDYCTTMEIASVIKTLEVEQDIEERKPLSSEHLSLISNLIVVSSLSNKERVTVMLKLLEKNIQWVRVSNERVKQYNESVKIIKNLSIIGELITLSTEGKVDARDLDIINNDEYIEMDDKNKYLEEYYFDKIDTYNTDDVYNFINVLKEIGITPVLCANINSVLIKRINQRGLITSESKKENNFLNQLSKKEYYQINNEISMYFDLENMKSIRYLSVSEKIQIVTLLKQLNYKNEDIERILSVIDNGNKKHNDTVDPVIEYADIMYKCAYYENQLGLEQYIQNVDEYIDEWLVASADDCVAWESVLKEEFDKIKLILPTTHEYEIEQANKLLQLK